MHFVYICPMEVYVYGATAHAKMAVDLAERLGVKLKGCVDKSLLLESIFNYPVELNHVPMSDYSYFLAIRNAELRQRMYEERSSLSYCTLLDPCAVISKYAEVDDGTIVFANAVISADVQIGKQVLIDAGVVVHSNTIVEDFVNIGANVVVGANVLIGKGVEIGAGSVILDESTIAPFTSVSPRSVIE